jgi:hypothetical protein
MSARVKGLRDNFSTVFCIPGIFIISLPTVVDILPELPRVLSLYLQMAA